MLTAYLSIKSKKHKCVFNITIVTVIFLLLQINVDKVSFKV